MTTDIIQHNGHTYQLIPQADDYGVQVSICKNGIKISDYSASATMEVAVAYDLQLGEKLLPLIIELVLDEIREGKFDKV